MTQDLFHNCMGTVFIFRFADSFSQDQTIADFKVACEILDEADSRFSLYKPESEISKLARGEINWADASQVQQEVKQAVEQWRNKTNSFFNPYSPEGKYDPSGLVKTWATANAAIYLEANGHRDFTINAGGDVYFGPAVKTEPLNRVGLSNLKPISAADASVNMILDLKNSDIRGVATSGSVERGEHIWLDQRNAEQFLQVTVAARDLITADIWATAIISGGEEAFTLFEAAAPEIGACAITTSRDGAIRSSRGFVSLLAALN